MVDKRTQRELLDIVGTYLLNHPDEAVMSSQISHEQLVYSFAQWLLPTVPISSSDINPELLEIKFDQQVDR